MENRAVFASFRLTKPVAIEHRAMGFNKRKMEDQRRQAAEKEAAARRATDAQVLEDAGRLIAAWNERQAKRMPMLFSPTIGAAITAGYWFLWVRCPACRTTNAIDLRALDHRHDAAVTSLIPALSCRSCRPNAPFAELVGLSRTSIATKCARRVNVLDALLFRNSPPRRPSAPSFHAMSRRRFYWPRWLKLLQQPFHLFQSFFQLEPF
jgi:hypothetical protein